MVAGGKTNKEIARQLIITESTVKTHVASLFNKLGVDSRARAVAVAQYLISKGVEPDRLAAAGFGEFQPLDQGTDEESRARNRRIELKLTER